MLDFDRYVEAEQEEVHENVDQLEWEKRQLDMAKLHFGSEDRRQRCFGSPRSPFAGAHSHSLMPSESQYDLVFEDQIDFIQQEILAGLEPGKEMPAQLDAAT